MSSTLTNRFNADRWLTIFISVHVLLWTIIPSLVRYNLPLDAMEGATWGHQLQWGYDKNPFMNGWLTALATQVWHQADWPVYLFSQLSVAICFWAVWKLAKCMLSPVYALLSVMLLEGIQYYNVHAIDFNDNTLELSLWALTGYYFYLALRQSTYKNWILTGLFAGLGMMTKYYTLALLGGMVLFLLTDAQNRKLLATREPYAGLMVFLLLLLPHVFWLFTHDYVTLHYMFDRASNVPRWANHYIYPLQFSSLQLQALAPALLLYLCLFIGKKDAAHLSPCGRGRREAPVEGCGSGITTSVNCLTGAPLTRRFASTSPTGGEVTFNRDFLMWVAVAPFAMTVMLSIIFGITLRGGWGTPLLSWFGILLFSLSQPALSLTKLHRFFAVILILMLASLAFYSNSLIDSDTPSSANFPGREIARTITQQWHDQYGTPLAYVAGSRWISGNIGLYSSDHPAAYLEWNKQHAPWIDEQQLRKRGAVFVWEISGEESLPPDVQHRYTRLQTPVVMEFDWYRNTHHLSPVRIGIAWLPPEATGSV